MKLEANILHVSIILHEEFDCGIYFCQATYFDSFWGTQGVSGGKKVKNCPSL